MFKSLGDDAIKGIANLWRGGPDVAKIMKSEVIESIPDAVHKAKLWKTTIVDDVEKGMAAAVKNINNEVKSYSTAAREANKELRQAQNNFAKIQKIAEDAVIKAENYKLRAKDYEMAARRIAEENELIRATRGELPMSRHTLLQSAAIRAQEAKRNAEYYMKVAAKESNAAGEAKLIRDRNQELFDIAQSKLDRLQDISHRIKTSPQSVAQELVNDTNIGKEFRFLDDWLDAATGNVNVKNQILKSTSRYINSSNRKFFKEYATEVLPGLKSGDRIALMWMSNPENAARLASLKRNRKFIDKFLELEHGKELRESLRGLTSRQIARKLKIAGVGTAGLAGAIGFMTWFDGESDEIVQESEDIGGELSSIKASGLGEVIVEQTIGAVEKINSVTQGAERAFGTDPSRAAPKYVSVIVEQKKIIDKNLGRWNIVVRSSNDSAAATRAGNALREYSKQIEAWLNGAGDAAGVRVSPGRAPLVPQSGQPGIAGQTRRLSREHIRGVQEFLKPKFPSVGPTGNLDAPTVRALQQLQREYDSLGETGRFSESGLLVRPNESHLIELNDLKKLDQLMNKYR